MQVRNQALSQQLEHQTATSHTLRVTYGSPTDVQPVFDAIVRSGARLCEADYGFLARYDGTSMSIVAHSSATDEEIKAMLRVYPRSEERRVGKEGGSRRSQQAKTERNAE